LVGRSIHCYLLLCLPIRSQLVRTDAGAFYCLFIVPPPECRYLCVSLILHWCYPSDEPHLSSSNLYCTVPPPPTLLSFSIPIYSHSAYCHTNSTPPSIQKALKPPPSCRVTSSCNLDVQWISLQPCLSTFVASLSQSRELSWSWLRARHNSLTPPRSLVVKLCPWDTSWSPTPLYRRIAPILILILGPGLLLKRRYGFHRSKSRCAYPPLPDTLFLEHQQQRHHTGSTTQNADL